MKLHDLALQLGVKPPKNLKGFELYNYIRRQYFQEFKLKYTEPFQSPSIDPTTINQRSKYQLKEQHGVYQRSDYLPLTLENNFNSFFPALDDTKPLTLAFNSGMGVISSLMYFLHNFKKINRLAIGENAYFETKWIADDYNRNIYFDEYKLNLPTDCDVYWIEFPVNCTQPDKYPFDKQLDLSIFFKKFLSKVRNSNLSIYLVIDYTLGFIPFDLTIFLQSLPVNVTIFLVSSLQKHRGYGLDLTNGGMITFYSRDKDLYESLKRIRSTTGTSITQETFWLMPPINNKLINKLIVDSGNEAKKIFEKHIPKTGLIRLYYSNNNIFNTSFIFVKIGKQLIKKSARPPYFSDLLIKEFIKSAKLNKIMLINSTSFGLPFPRIFKNSERYSNTDSLRIAIGYDPDLNNNLNKVIDEGIDSFLKKYD